MIVILVHSLRHVLFFYKLLSHVRSHPCDWNYTKDKIRVYFLCTYIFGLRLSYLKGGLVDLQKVNVRFNSVYSTLNGNI
jgi:hypothetical protein